MITINEEKLKKATEKVCQQIQKSNKRTIKKIKKIKLFSK